MLTRLALALAGVILLAGCSASAPQEPVEPALPPGDVASDDCIVGIWNLDVATYSADSESFMLSLGIPLDYFLMDGDGKLTLTNDGLAATDIALNIDISIAGNVIEWPSYYTATGDWSRTGEQALQFDNWTSVGDEPDLPPDVELPDLDITQLSGVTSQCSADKLFLQGPDAPFGSTWTR